MTDKYTPTTEQIVSAFALARGYGLGDVPECPDDEAPEDAVKRWLAAHEAAIRADERAKADRPAPCDMKHTPPFDFAHCLTHDTTFPLDGACKWHGKDSIYQVIEDEAAEQRLRAVRAEIDLERLRAEQGEPEGRRWFTPAYRSLGGGITAFGYGTVVQEHAQRQADQFTREDPEGPDYFVATRVLPPWERLEPVNESEKP